jgi:hypothetical protein
MFRGLGVAFRSMPVKAGFSADLRTAGRVLAMAMAVIV